MNRYAAWRYLLIVAVLVFAVIYAMPNIYGEDPAVQISQKGADITLSELENIRNRLRTDGVGFDSVELLDGTIIVRFSDTETQLAELERIQDLYEERYLVAANLVPATPDWLRDLGALPMYLGLDLRGGIHFLMQIDMATALNQTLESNKESIRTLLRSENIRSRGTTVRDGRIVVRFSDAASRDRALSQLQDDYAELTFTTEDAGEYAYLYASLRPEALTEERRAAVTQNIVTLRNRINELGVAEPVVQRQGEDRIVVQLPGVQDTARAKDVIGATATLEYRLVHGSTNDALQAERTGRIPTEARLYRTRTGEPVLLKRSVIVGGENVTGATSSFDQNGSPAVVVTLDGNGAERMGDVTGQNIGNLMAVVYIDNKVETRDVNGVPTPITTRSEEVISVATIQDQLNRRFQTTGLTQQEAADLALLLRSGALKAPMQIVEERTVGPSLGKDNIEQGFNSVILGLVIVLVFMVIYYRSFGVIANLALVMNLGLLIAFLSLLQATLTLPGIAGIVLTVGMAVDANVLIFERIREELRAGQTFQSAIHAGYEKAFSTITDANITTFIAAIVLFGFGTGPIKGFAVTLSIGILTSMFTAIFVSRGVVNFLFRNKTYKPAYI